MKRRPAKVVILIDQFALVSANDGVADRETETNALVLSRKKGLEKVMGLISWDSWSIVRHGHFHTLGDATGGNYDASRFSVD
jgi:hypothetical protein